MLFKKSMLLLTFLFVSTTAISQISLKKVIITGKIIDKETTKPIEFAVITISKSDTKKIITGGTSDANGNFSIELNNGTYNLKYEFPGFKTQEKLNQTIADKENQITIDKGNAKTAADNAKNEGRVEAFTSTVNFYKNRPFDELIKSSTKESIAREIQLLGNNPEIKLVLNDLQIYFNALVLLSEKFDSIKIKNAQTQLNQIKHQSKLLEALKNDVEFYQDFNTALKEAINKLVNLDKFKLAGGDSEIQKLKFNDIVTILTDYIYNYYDYAKYPYLSDIMLEIIKRKQPNADADIIDLLKKIE